MQVALKPGAQDVPMLCSQRVVTPASVPKPRQPSFIEAVCKLATERTGLTQYYDALVCAVMEIEHTPIISGVRYLLPTVAYVLYLVTPSQYSMDEIRRQCHVGRIAGAMKIRRLLKKHVRTRARAKF